MDAQRQTKGRIRKILRQRRDSLTEAEIARLSEEICGKIRRQPWYQEAEILYFYYPLGSETDLLALAAEALERGKCVAFPRVAGLDMEFYQVRDLGEFQEGSFHVMEPAGDRLIRAAGALVLVPGLGFDARGNRIGYGKGYYDRYFARYPGCRKVGVAYGAQLVEALACDAQDVAMDAVATERGVRYFRDGQNG